MGRTYNSTPVLSKIKIGDNYYYVKDADARALLDSINDNVWAKLQIDIGSVATTGSEGLAVAKDVKTYVDAAIGGIIQINYKVVENLPEASAEVEFNKSRTIYLKRGSGTAYYEYICIKEGTSTYKWEKIGSTDIDLTSYVKAVTYTDASHMLKVTHGSNQETLVHTFGALADKSSASGTVESQDITGVKATYTPSGSVTVSTATATVTSSGSYTPAGNVNVVTGEDVVIGGSINVTVKDASLATEASLTTTSYTPTGTIAPTTGGTFTALKSAIFQENSTGGTQIAGTVSKPNVNLTSSSVTVATGITGGSVASFDTTKFHGGSKNADTFNAGNVNFGTFDGGTAASVKSTVAFAKSGVVAAMGSGDDAECLIFTAAATENAVTDINGGSVATWTGATYTAPSYTEGAFTAASMDAGIFTANTLQTVTTATVNDVTAAALAEAPVFTGNKYEINTTSDTALKEVAFTATNSADIVNKVEYKKQEIDVATFSATKGGLSFAGSQATIDVSGNYDKVSGAEFTGTADEAAVGTITVAAKTVTVQ